MTTVPLLLRNVELDGRQVDCLLSDGVVEQVGPGITPPAGSMVVDGGGALMPGLSDHHLHLFAMAAAAESLDLSGDGAIDRLRDGAESARLRGRRLRAVGWDPPRHGDLDRKLLDKIGGDTPIRVQDRSGALWVLNSAALAQLPLEQAPAGVERDIAGRPTGRVWREDRWLRTAQEPPDLADVGEQLTRFGVVAVTDATPDVDAATVTHVAAAMISGALPQRVQLLGARDVPAHPERLTLGPHKLVVGDHHLPDPDALTAAISAAHDAQRAVAVHCVSRAALALTIAALRSAGVLRGDRIEHCAVADLSAVGELRDLGVIVVTQPSLIARRGDDYLDRHPSDEHPDLWRYGSLLDHGVRTVASSDAPYGDVDPWATMRAARDRRTGRDRVIGADERVNAETVLTGLLAPTDDPAEAPRRVMAGGPADLVVLRRSRAAMMASPDASAVAATIIGGRIVYRAGE